MIDVAIAMRSAPDVDSWVNGFVASVETAAPVVAQVLLEAADSCFETQSDPWGNEWEPHSDSTLEAIARRAAGPTRVRRNFIGPLQRGERSTRDRRWTRRRSERAASAIFNAKILIDRGILRGSLAPSPALPTPGVVTARVHAGGAAAAYAGVHQWGSKDGDTPARPYLALRGNPDAPTVDLPPAVYAEVVSTFQDSIDSFVQRANAER